MINKYDFNIGERFEPDYMLIAQKTQNDGYKQQQIFVEPKGVGFIPKNVWKDEFLIQIKQRAVIIKTYTDDNVYKIIGLPFYNAIENNDVFVAAIKKLYAD
jgi:type III restriction enzyme